MSCRAQSRHKFDIILTIEENYKMQYNHSEHPISPEGKQFLASLTQEQRNLQTLAQKMLGSSYFIEKTHGFKMWVAANATPKPPAKKE
jgi:hypothetical protein